MQHTATNVTVHQMQIIVVNFAAIAMELVLLIKVNAPYTHMIIAKICNAMQGAQFQIVNVHVRTAC